MSEAQLSLRIRFKTPEDGPKTLLIFAPASMRLLRWIKAARIRLPDSETWVAFGGAVRDLEADPHILGLRTLTDEDQERYMRLKVVPRSTDLIVVEFEKINGTKLPVVQTMHGDRYDRYLAERQRRLRVARHGGSAA